MNILLTGADGFIGCRLLTLLTAAGHRVRPASRRHGCDFAAMTRPQQWRPWLKEMDAAINCVGIFSACRTARFEEIHTAAPVALFQACAEHGVARVTQISALGARGDADTPFLRSKGQADAALQHLPLAWMVLRPSLVEGAGGASAGLLRRLARLPLIPLPGDGQQAVQPVHVDDVAMATLLTLETQAPRRVIEVAGPARFTLAGWLQALRRAEGLGDARFCPLPLSLCRAACLLGKGLSPLLQPDALDMLQAGSCADIGPLRQLLGRAPQPPLPACAMNEGVPA
ncbi:NAD-dependent epimerase/dehydratase family protein [uncultured Aquitalea sp.]|uniref:NAD-dependent epimerase/dehydratase family protein n=1 Tax=uncultured Aquitalea sp. TaxID=540272 RepID=UPI0025E8ECB5|nr:NAD-dependent epimerase/dehydratase family protein [uncultured Aquitalea sp.]